MICQISYSFFRGNNVSAHGRILEDVLTRGGVPWAIRWTAADQSSFHIYGPPTAWRAIVPILPTLFNVEETGFAGVWVFCIGGASPKRAI